METLRSPIVVLTDHSGNRADGFVLTEQSKQLLTCVRSLTSGSLIAIALNPEPDTVALSHYGSDIVAVADLAGHSPRVASIVADIVHAGIKKYAPGAVFCVSNARGREVAATVAALTQSGVAVDVTQISVDNDRLIAGKAVLSGTWETRFHMIQGIPVIGMKTAGMVAEHADTPGDAAVEPLDVTYRQCAQAVTVVSSTPNASAAQNLIDAPIVVCAGAATKGDFTVIRRLAERLGATIGATRVCTDEGWIDRSAQVGLSGVSISPQLYIGAGISGDIHHVSGIRGAQTIVAINNDPDAPIFELADLGIIGDLNQVIPQALDHLG